jgi:hypothetical protein
MCASMHVLHGYFGTYMISLPVSEVKGLEARVPKEHLRPCRF